MASPSTHLVNWAALCLGSSCSCSSCKAMLTFGFPPGRCIPPFVWDGAKAFAPLFRQLTLAWHSYEHHTSAVAGPLWPWPYSYSSAIGVSWPEQRSRNNSLIWQMKKGRLKWGATDSSASSLDWMQQSMQSRGFEWTSCWELEFREHNLPQERTGNCCIQVNLLSVLPRATTVLRVLRSCW